MHQDQLKKLKDDIVASLPNHPISVMAIVLKYSENTSEALCRLGYVSRSDVQAALLYLNEDGRIYFDEVQNVLLYPPWSKKAKLTIVK